MRFRSIKYRITFWYTSIIVLVFGIVLVCAVLYSEYYGENEIKAELLDEVKDLREDVVRYSSYFPEAELTSYYDDGVMLSIYDADFEMINGILPDEFPTDLHFVDDGIREVESEEDNWFVNDSKVVLSDGTRLWIRGIHSYSSIMIMIQRLTVLMAIIFPVLIVFTAYAGHRMIKQSLKPMKTIVDTAEEITSTSALNRRIPLPDSKDEFYHLSSTFNQMFDRLESNFLKERQFSSDAAHELRTPVSVILSHCEYCLEEMELDKEMEKEINVIKQKAQQMSDLVSSLLAISREEKRLANPEPEWVDLKMLAESVAEELEEKAAKKDIRIQVVNHLENANVLADMSMLTRLFMNLTENAIAYGNQSGYVKILLEEAEDKVCLKFEDDGIGISEEDQMKIWNRFYQADKSHSKNKGFGLGLPMVKQIVDAHKGMITVESELGKGTTFIVVIPKK